MADDTEKLKAIKASGLLTHEIIRSCMKSQNPMVVGTIMAMRTGILLHKVHPELADSIMAAAGLDSEDLQRRWFDIVAEQLAQYMPTNATEKT